MIKKLLVILVVLAVGGGVWYNYASAATTAVVRLDMNEVGQRTVVDSIGGDDNLAVAVDCPSDPQLASLCARVVSSGGRTLLRTPYIQNHSSSPKVEGRVSRINHRGELNPGTGDFAITVTFKNNGSYGNIIQKGQSGTPGGYYKWEMPSGRLTCLMRDSQNRNLVVKTPSGMNLKDGQFHTYTCQLRRLSGGRAELLMILDGNRVGRGSGYLGSVANDWPISVGGKSQCDQVRVTCDFFFGDVDSIEIQGNAAAATQQVVQSEGRMNMDQLQHAEATLGE